MTIEEGPRLKLFSRSMFDAGRLNSSTDGVARAVAAAAVDFLPPSEFARVERLIARKYRLDRILILPLCRAVQRLRGVDVGSETAVLASTPL